MVAVGNCLLQEVMVIKGEGEGGAVEGGGGDDVAEE